ncbi:MAG: transposase [Solirubrobacteraceae bacterium]
MLGDETVKAAFDLLGELIGQDFDVDDDDVPRLHRGTRPGRIISTIDPEMQHGRKSSSQRFDGFKLSAAVTNSETPLIMAVHIAPGGEADGPQAKHLIDSQAAGQRPAQILGDTAYGNGPVRQELADRDVVLTDTLDGDDRVTGDGDLGYERPNDQSPSQRAPGPWERRQGGETGGMGACGGALRVCDRFAVAVDRSA